MIIWMMLYVPKYEGKWYCYIPFARFHMYHFCQTNIVTAKLIAKALLKSFYSRLGFKVIKDFAKSPKFKEARKRFDYESGKSKTMQKNIIGLQCRQTFPRRVSIINYN